MSLNSNNGDEFKYTLVFTRVGIYKERLYAIKKFKSSKIELTRILKKELKNLRDLKHENINQFIGASLELEKICIGKLNFTSPLHGAY